MLACGRGRVILSVVFLGDTLGFPPVFFDGRGSVGVCSVSFNIGEPAGSWRLVGVGSALH